MAAMTVTGAPEVNAAFQLYCEAIFELQEDDVDVIQARIAERLGVSRPAVSEMVRRLEHEGLVSLNGGIALTPDGRSLAESVVRRHRLAERMLVDILGLSWAVAHEEAGRWERVISPAVEAAMVSLLGDPTTCPHGNPIPGTNYAAPETVVLRDVRPGDRFEVIRVPEELEFTPGVLQFLEQANLTPGRRGVVTMSSPDGTVTVDIDGERVGVGAFAATRILVRLAG
jgi:DtxR family Mn-dependent transcriptional regulator